MNDNDELKARRFVLPPVSKPRRRFDNPTTFENVLAVVTIISLLAACAAMLTN